MRDTIKAAKSRLARFDGRKVYSFSHKGYRPTMRTGVRKIGA